MGLRRDRVEAFILLCGGCVFVGFGINWQTGFGAFLVSLILWLESTS